MSWTDEVKQLLDKGVYCDNLLAIADIARAGYSSDSERLGAFVIADMARGLASLWDGPITQSEAERIERLMKKPLSNVVEAIATKQPPDKIAARLSEAINVYLDV